MYEQISIFDGNECFKISKPIRLIECFAGYGSQHLALKYLGVDVESYRICEWAVKSIQAYKDLHFPNDTTDYSADLSTDEVIDYLADKGISANYNNPMTREQVKRMGEAKCRQVYNNIKATHNLVNIMQAKASDLDIVERDKYCYIMTYSFPCQDLSKAGLGKGMAKDSGTRSGLLWEVERLLDECNENLPQVLLMENVPDVIGTKNIKHFAKWLEKLETIGYKCYWKVLNGKDYGIPQNRERCFMVSILGDYFYSFPYPIKLEKRLKDLLETNVDEKYYLSDVALKGLQNTTFHCSTLEARTEKDAKLVVEPQCIQIDLEQTVRVRKYEVDIPNLQKTLKAHKNLTNKQIAERLNKPITEVEHWFRTDKYFNIPNEDVWFALKELLGITTDKFDKSIMEFEIKPNEFDMANRGYLDIGLSPTITTQETPKCIQAGVLSGGKWDKMHDQSRRYYDPNGLAPTMHTCGGGNLEPKIIEPICLNSKVNGKQPSLNDRVYDINAISFAMTTSPFFMGNIAEPPDEGIRTFDGNVMGTLRIRKLTPKECWRLMGVKDEDFERVAQNQSNSSLYHLAGDSIIADVLMALFKQML